MQTTNTLSDYMRAHGIEVRITDGPELTTDDNGWEHNAYRFTLTIRGEMMLGNAPWRAGTGISTPADPVDVFGGVVMDAQSVAPYLDSREQMDYDVDAQTRQNVTPTFPPSGWEEWADSIGEAFERPADAVASMRAFQEMAARAALLREMLGDDAYDAMLELEV